MTMKTIVSINPHDGSTVGSFVEQNEAEIEAVLTKTRQGQQGWQQISVDDRSKMLATAASLLRKKVEIYARMITLEMGKPISESRAEVAKCAWVCEYYAEHASSFLASERIRTDASKSYVRHDPLGSVLAIMPWNFPFWQVFRFAAPALIAGNAAVLKHASNVYGCSRQIEGIFGEAGVPEGVFQSVILGHARTLGLIADDRITAVTLTGSESAGSAAAAAAGKHLKKSVLELGGNNAFVVLRDADVPAAVSTALTARMLNCGQSCIAAKRFILVRDIYDEFVSAFTDKVKELRVGNPLDEETQVGPLARQDLADELQRQVRASVDKGATLLFGGQQNGCYHDPTVLADVVPGMPAFDEETFGPLASMVRAEDEADAMTLAQTSVFGLGMTVCTKDTTHAEELAAQVSDGAFFVNELVKSDPRLPFGGTQKSGYGRELAKDGIMEFVNRKTVYIR